MHQIRALTVSVVISLLLISVLGAKGNWNEDSSFQLNSHWENFKATYNKNYDSIETEKIRRQIWESNMRYIDNHNLRFLRGETSFSLAMNTFGDLSKLEYANYTCSTPPNSFHRHGGSWFRSRVNASDVPVSVDWRVLGYVTPVKDQGKCRSCWAIATTGSVEGQYFRYTGKLLNFSHQQLVDCSQNDHGCQGAGSYFYAFKYLCYYGLETEEDYPQTGTYGSCKYKEDKTTVNVLSYKDVNSQDLEEAVATIGPITVGLDGRHLSFRFYHSGVYDEPNCVDNVDGQNHIALVVGYDFTGDTPHWIVKNSWGTDWGERGYIRISKSHECGIRANAIYPIV